MKFSFCALFLVACTGGQDGYLVTSQTSQGFGCLEEPYGCGYHADYQAEQITLTSEHTPATRIGTLTGDGIAELERLVSQLPSVPPTFESNCADAGRLTLNVKFDSEVRTYETEVDGCAAGQLKPIASFLANVHRAIISGCTNHPFVVCQ